MAENDDVAGTPDDDPSPAQDAAAADQPTAVGRVLPPDAAAPAPAARTRWRDRVWSFRAMLAVAAPTLVIGGVTGGLVGAAVDDGHDDGYRMGPGGPAMRMPPGWRNHDGPHWRWRDGPPPPGLTPYGGPSTPAPSPSAPGSTG
jgi:hypothetical protein